MKSNTLVFLLIAAGLAAAYFLTRGKTGVTGTGSRFTSSGTATPPNFWSVGAAPGRLIRIQAPAGAPAWASVASSSVNALGELAAKYWQPNRSVETQGGGRADYSPTYSTRQDYFQAQSDAALLDNNPNALTSQFEHEADVPDFNEDLI